MDWFVPRLRNRAHARNAWRAGGYTRRVMRERGHEDLARLQATVREFQARLRRDRDRDRVETTQRRVAKSRRAAPVLRREPAR